MRARANRGYARGSRGGDPAGGGGRMPGTGPALDHGGDAVELRRVRSSGSFSAAFREVRKPAGGRATLGLGAEFVHTGRVSAPTVHWPTHLSDKCQTFGGALPRAVTARRYHRANRGARRALHGSQRP